MASRLLLVENEQSLVDLLVRYLTRSGFEVSSAPSAESALELLRVPDGCVSADTVNPMGPSVPPVALAVIDLSLSGGMTGVDLLAALRAKGLNFPILLYSGYPFAVETLASGLQTNVWFLQKPFMPRVLMETILSILDARVGERDPV